MLVLVGTQGMASNDLQLLDLNLLSEDLVRKQVVSEAGFIRY